MYSIARSNPPPWWRSPELWIFAAALFLRLLHLVWYKNDFWFRLPLLDDNLFYSWAGVIRREGWLARSLGIFDLNPAYPYFLAVVQTALGEVVQIARWRSLWRSPPYESSAEA